MEYIHLFTILTLTLGTHAFLLNHFNLGATTSDDLSHTDITRTAVLRVVARFLEGDPPPGKTIKPGSLTGLKPLTAQAIFDAYYGGGASADKLQSAIDQILKGEYDTFTSFSKKAAYQFNAERIVEGNTILQNLRTNLFEMLSSATPDYEAARNVIGSYFYTLHMFYCNTNWMEEKGGQIYEALGIPGAALMPVAPDSLATCASCDSTSLTTCKNNLINTDGVLTSGYRSGQDIKKPIANHQWKGKCSHGGYRDTSAKATAVGGINKETSDPKMSPHYHLHRTAGEAAIKASEALLDGKANGLRWKIGDISMGKLFDLGSGSSIVFVIDNSGSMGNDIAAVKAESIKIVKETMGTSKAPYDYVLSTFSDPVTLGTIRTTRKADEFLQWLEKLTVSGGGDCPEYSLTGLFQAMHIALPGSTLYVFTDASAKDRDKYSDVISLIKKKRFKVQFLLTGDCGPGRFKRHIQRRAAGNVDLLYTGIAQNSGGTIIVTDKGKIQEAVKVIRDNIMDSPVTLKKFQALATSRRSYSILVDDALDRVNIQITGQNGLVKANLFFQNGTDAGANKTTNIDRLLVLQLKQVDPDNYTLQFDDNQFYTVDVTGNSRFNFKFTFVDEDEFGTAMPMQGNPIAGTNVTVIIQTSGTEKVQSVDSFTANDQQGNVLMDVSLQSGTGSSNYIHRATFTLPKQDFHLVLFGHDKSGHITTRTFPQPVTPSNVQLVLLPADDQDTLLPGGNITVPFQITNFGPQIQVTIKVAIDPVFGPGLAGTFLELKKDAVYKGSVLFSVSRYTRAGKTGTALFTITGAGNKVFNSLTKLIMVSSPPIKPDLKTPNCTLLETYAMCTTASKCESTEWGGNFTIYDEDSGLQSVRLFGSNKDVSSLSVPPLNASSLETVARYSTSCCNAQVIIAAADRSGNEVHCVATYNIPVAQEGQWEAWEIGLLVAGVILIVFLILLVVILVVQRKKISVVHACNWQSKRTHSQKAQENPSYEKDSEAVVLKGKR